MPCVYLPSLFYFRFTGTALFALIRDVIEADFYCKYCFDVYQAPVSLACGHSVCRPCARNAFDYEVLKTLRQPSALDAGQPDEV